MRRSFVRLTIRSVLVGWATAFVVIGVYVTSQNWTEARARRSGVFLVYEMLDPLPVADRADRLAALEPHFSTPFGLYTRSEVERLIGRRVGPGERIHHERFLNKERYALVFHDGSGALVAGPVNPAVPAGVVPIGVILAVVGLPAIAVLVALRVERELDKVERASDALRIGELSARVDNQDGPSNELAASFNAMAERIERLIRSRDELVQAVSHELGSPLSRLRFHLELLETSSHAQHDKRTEAMTRELDALEGLVAELLGYVQSDELKLDLRLFDPRRDLSDLAELTRLEAPEKLTVDVVLEVQDAQMMADQRLFQRAVENLLRNAVQHAEARVRVELTLVEDAVRVAVEDDGPGIPESLRDKVTAPFYRLEKDRARQTGGVGLGLAIVSRIMERHGGRMNICAAPFGGARVELFFPKVG